MWVKCDLFLTFDSCKNHKINEVTGEDGRQKVNITSE